MWRLRVDNAVGVISTADLQIAVEPKIPKAHLLHLFERSGAIPRMEEQRALVEADEPLWKLVMAWFVTSAEKVVRRGLMRDYTPLRAEIPVVRGKIHTTQTLLNIYRGRVLADCEFEEFEFDTPLNRLLLAAARTVASNPALDDLLRRRALRIAGWLDELVGEFQVSDLATAVDRRTAHYADATALARHVMRGSGRTSLRSSSSQTISIFRALMWVRLTKPPSMMRRKRSLRTKSLRGTRGKA
jgi:5-methylcytosine-specific restriction endonuclease McrBC regulatory subunit McrC